MTNILRLRAALLGSGAALALVAISAVGGTALAGEKEELQARLDTLRARLDQLEKQRAVAEAKAPVAAPADAVVGGDYPGSFKLPGGDTSYSIHGRTWLEFVMDIDQPGSSNSNFSPEGFSPNNRPAGNQGLRTNLFIEDSRINFQSRTPTAYGTLRTFIEGDFRGSLGGTDNVLPDNRGGFRLRHAYGELGPLLAGMTSTLRADEEASVERVKRAYIAGPKGASDRTPQVRYTLPYGKFSFAASVEAPGSTSQAKVAVSNGVGQFFDKAGPSVTNQQVEMPNFAGAVAYKDTWGHARVSGRLRQLRLNNGLGGDVGGTNFDVDKFGYGGMVSGDLKLGYFFPALGKDRIAAGANWATGLAFSEQGGDDSQSLTVVRFGTAGQRAFTNPSWGANIGATHWWAGNLRSSLAYGISKFHLSHDIGFANVDVTDSRQVTDFQEILANLIWSPVKSVNFGVEYEYGEKHNLSTATGYTGFGSDNRVTVGMQYLF